MPNGYNVAQAQRLSATRMRNGTALPRPPVDPCYLDRLAKRLAAEACLPLAMARKHVAAVAILAQEAEA
jgi:hypothetical protein